MQIFILIQAIVFNFALVTNMLIQLLCNVYLVLAAAVLLSHLMRRANLFVQHVIYPKLAHKQQLLLIYLQSTALIFVLQFIGA